MSEPAHTEGRRPDDELRALARSMTELFRAVNQLAGEGKGEDLSSRLEEHLGVEPKGLPVVSQTLPFNQLVDVQVALDVWPTEGPDRASDVIGVSGDQRRFHPLSELLTKAGPMGVGVGPVDYVDMPDSPDSTRSCVKFGLFLLTDCNQSCAALLRGGDPHGPMQAAMIELIAEDRSYASAVLAELRRLAVDHSVLRGQVLTVGEGEGNQYGALRFMRRPNLSRHYLREVVRRAALRSAANSDGPLRVTGVQLREAAQDLLDDRASLTRSLLGGPVEPDAEPPIGGPPMMPPMPMGGVRGAWMLRQHGSSSTPPFAPDA